MLWKSYIDFEIEQEETERTRNLYRRLLQRTQHVKVFCDLCVCSNQQSGRNSVFIYIYIYICMYFFFIYILSGFLLQRACESQDFGMLSLYQANIYIACEQLGYCRLNKN